MDKIPTFLLRPERSSTLWIRERGATFRFIVWDVAELRYLCWGGWVLVTTAVLGCVDGLMGGCVPWCLEVLCFVAVLCVLAVDVLAVDVLAVDVLAG